MRSPVSIIGQPATLFTFHDLLMRGARYPRDRLRVVANARRRSGATSTHPVPRAGCDPLRIDSGGDLAEGAVNARETRRIR